MSAAYSVGPSCLSSSVCTVAFTPSSRSGRSARPAACGPTAAAPELSLLGDPLPGSDGTGVAIRRPATGSGRAGLGGRAAHPAAGDEGAAGLSSPGSSPSCVGGRGEPAMLRAVPPGRSRRTRSLRAAASRSPRLDTWFTSGSGTDGPTCPRTRGSAASRPDCGATGSPVSWLASCRMAVLDGWPGLDDRIGRPELVAAAMSMDVRSGRRCPCRGSTRPSPARARRRRRRG